MRCKYNNIWSVGLHTGAYTVCMVCTPLQRKAKILSMSKLLQQQIWWTWWMKCYRLTIWRINLDTLQKNKNWTLARQPGALWSNVRGTNIWVSELSEKKLVYHNMDVCQGPSASAARGPWGRLNGPQNAFGQTNEGPLETDVAFLWVNLPFLVFYISS